MRLLLKVGTTSYYEQFKRHYRVTQKNLQNLLLTWFRQFRQLVGRYCSSLLPRQDGGTSLIGVNRRFCKFFCVTLY